MSILAIFLRFAPGQTLSRSAALIVGLAAVASARAEPGTGLRSEDTESRDRVVDRAAVEIQRMAIKQIEMLMAMPANKPKEADLLYKLGVANLEAANIQFRIGQERAYRKGGVVNLKDHNLFTKNAINALSRMLVLYPKDERAHEALFMRATAFDDIKDLKTAERDYRDLIKKYPEVPESSPSHMKIAEYATERKDHAEAVRQLLVLEKRPDDLLHPFALYKLAWANFNLGQVPTGLAYLKAHITYYNKRIDPKDETRERLAGSSEEAIRENSLRDLSLFAFEGFQKKVSGYTLPAMIAILSDAAAGNPVDPSIVRFTALLRTKNEYEELEQWNQIVEQSTLKRETVLAASGIVFENLNNRRQFETMSKTLSRIRSLMSKHPELMDGPAAGDILKTVEESTTFLHKTIQENKDNPQVKKLVKSMELIYGLLDSLSKPGAERLAQAHYNQAETYFLLKDYPEATKHYRAVLSYKLEAKKDAAAPQLDLRDVSLRALAARYELLKKQKVIPEKLEPRSLAQDKPSAPLNPLYVEWAGWIDEHMKTHKDESEVFKTYDWEASRVLYSSGHLSETLTHLEGRIAVAKTLEKDDAPMLNLHVDTLILSQDWARLNAYTKLLLKRDVVKDPESVAKLKTLESDSWIKLAEGDFERKDFKEALKKAESCGESGEKIWICRFLEAQVIRERDGFLKAVPALSKIVEQSPDAELRDKALLIRAAGYRSEARFKESLQDELMILERGSSDKGLSARIFQSALLAGDPLVLKSLASHTGYCKAAAEECRVLQALLKVRGFGGAADVDVKALSAKDKKYRALFAFANLDRYPKSYTDTLAVAGVIADSWKQLDSLVTLHLAGAEPGSVKIADRMKEIFHGLRGRMASSYAVTHDPYTVQRRIRRLKDFEKAAAGMAAGFAWVHVQQPLLLEVAGAYRDFAAEVNVPEFSKPLEDQAAQIEKRAQGLVQAKDLAAAPLDRSVFMGHFPEVSPREERVFESLKEKNLPKAGYFIAVLGEDKAFDKGRLRMLRAVLLDAAGARTEALREYETLSPQVDVAATQVPAKELRQ